MGMHETDSARLVALFEQIRERQARDEEQTNYKDAPALHEMAAIIRPYAARLPAEDADALGDIGAVCQFLGRSYQEMFRGVYAAEFYTAAFYAGVLQAQAEGKAMENAEELLSAAVKARNFYVDDDCAGLKEAALQVLTAEEVARIATAASRRTLKRDPVEMTEGYLAVIDEVERKVEENMDFHGRGSCHQRWSLTREYLEEYGIVWRSLGAMNPRFHFD